MKRKIRLKRGGSPKKKTSKFRRSTEVSRPVRKEKEIYFIELPGASPPRYLVRTEQGRIMWTYNKYMMTQSDANLLLYTLKKKFDHVFKIKKDGRKRHKLHI